MRARVVAAMEAGGWTDGKDHNEMRRASACKSVERCDAAGLRGGGSKLQSDGRQQQRRERSRSKSEATTRNSLCFGVLVSSNPWDRQVNCSPPFLNDTVSSTRRMDTFIFYLYSIMYVLLKTNANKT